MSYPIHVYEGRKYRTVDPDRCIASVPGISRSKQCSRKPVVVGSIMLWGEPQATGGLCRQHSKGSNVEVLENA